jgi:O-methyltransferase involved in polyketide biosynthesis
MMSNCNPLDVESDCSLRLDQAMPKKPSSALSNNAVCDRLSCLVLAWTRLRTVTNSPAIFAFSKWIIRQPKRPDSLVYAPVDFESDALLDGLNAVGFDSAQRTFFIWLGVVPYLTEKAIDLTLRAIANLAGGAEVVFDYSDPPASFSPELLALHEARAARVAAAGEPFLSYFDPPALHKKLRELGFSEIDDVIARNLLSRYLGQATPAERSTGDSAQPRSGGGHVLFAATQLA